MVFELFRRVEAFFARDAHEGARVVVFVFVSMEARRPVSGKIAFAAFVRLFSGVFGVYVSFQLGGGRHVRTVAARELFRTSSVFFRRCRRKSRSAGATSGMVLQEAPQNRTYVAVLALV